MSALKFVRELSIEDDDTMGIQKMQYVGAGRYGTKRYTDSY